MKQRFVVEEQKAVRTPEPELVAITDLRAHARNYRAHPDDQIEHLAASLKEHGLYRNVVIAQDGTILAGHGVVEAAKRLRLEAVRAIRLPIAPDSPAALKVLTGDNEIEHLAEQDDRLLSELLREIAESDPLELLGTGYDDAMLANLVYVTRPASEIRDFDEAAHWVGMPEAAEPRPVLQLIVHFTCEADRDTFIERSGVGLMRSSSVQGFTGWWPPRGREDLGSLAYEAADA